MAEFLSPTDMALRNWASNGAADGALTAFELQMVPGQIPALCGELLAMRAADPRACTRALKPEQVDADTLAFWRDCFECNPDYALQPDDVAALSLAVPSAAAELLAYRLLITKEKTKKGTALRKALAARARRCMPTVIGRAA